MADRPQEEFSTATSMRERVEAALASGAAREKTEITLKISGGLPQQSYDFDFRAGGDGRATCSFRNRLRKRDGKKSGRLKRERYAALLDTCVQSGLLEQPTEHGPFLPDTLVGCLEICSNEHSYKTYFAADPEQAKTQGMEPSASLSRVVDTIYAEGARLLGKRSVKP